LTVRYSGLWKKSLKFKYPVLLRVNSMLEWVLRANEWLIYLCSFSDLLLSYGFHSTWFNELSSRN
jgi:hypothetical protein